MVLSEETQKVVGVLLKVSQVLTEMMDNILPVVSKLQSYLSSVKDLNLGANNEFRQVMTFYSHVNVSFTSFIWSFISFIYLNNRSYHFCVQFSLIYRGEYVP